MKMIFSIQYMQRTPFGEPSWRTQSRNSIDDFENSLCDIGHDVGALLEDMMKLAKPYERLEASRWVSPVLTFPALIERTLELVSAVETWWNELSIWAPKPFYWREQRAYETDESPIADNSRASRTVIESSIVYQDIRLALVSMDCWAIHLVLCTTMDRARKQMPWIARLHPSVQRFLAVAARYDGSFQLRMATDIFDSCSYTMRPEMGLVGPQKSLFSLRVALMIFRAHPGPYAQRQTEDTGRLLRGLATKCGLRYAKDLESRRHTFERTGLEANDGH